MTNRLYQVEVPSEYIVVNWDTKPHRFFAKWHKNPQGGKSVPCITENIGRAMVFAYEGMAEHIADQLGDGWRVLNVSKQEVEKAKKLLDALFREDEDDEEWADGIGQTFSPD